MTPTEVQLRADHSTHAENRTSLEISKTVLAGGPNQPGMLAGVQGSATLSAGVTVEDGGNHNGSGDLVVRDCDHDRTAAEGLNVSGQTARNRGHPSE